MLKKILKKSPYLLIPFFAYSLYVYIFPIYPDFDIPEEYFHTRFHDEWFDSPNNWFHAWKEIIEWLEEDKELINDFHNYNECFLDNWCHSIDSDITQEEIDALYQSVVNDTELMSNFWNILYTFLEDTESIMLEYDFISYRNFEVDGSLFSVGWEITSDNQMIRLIRAMRLYIHLSDTSEKIELLDRYLAVLSWLSYNVDSDIITYLVIITLHNIIYNHIEFDMQNMWRWHKNILSRIVEKHTISDDMVYNGSRYWYFFGKKAYEGTIFQEVSFFERLFYNSQDTLNVLRKLEYNRSERIYEALEYRWININIWLEMIATFFYNSYYDYVDDNLIILNWRNMIWRAYLNAIYANFDSAFKREEELIQRRLEIIDLLSN